MPLSMGRRAKQGQGASRFSRASSNGGGGFLPSWENLRISTRLQLLLKALCVWALFTVGGWIAIPLELVPLFSHCVGLGFYLVIVTQKARWLIPVSLGGLVYLCIVYFTVPPTAWALTTHILGYAGLVVLVITHVCLKWVGADLQPQAERLLESVKDALPSVDMLPAAERVMEYVALLVKDRLTIERLLDTITGGIADGINGIDVQLLWAFEVLRCRLGTGVDWFKAPGMEWRKVLAAMPTQREVPSPRVDGGRRCEGEATVATAADGRKGIGLALGALLARALALAADCPGGISSALGSTAEAILAHSLSLYPKRCVKFLLDILVAADDVEDDDGILLDDAGWPWQPIARSSHERPPTAHAAAKVPIAPNKHAQVRPRPKETVHKDKIAKVCKGSIPPGKVDSAEDDCAMMVPAQGGAQSCSHKEDKPQNSANHTSFPALSLQSPHSLAALCLSIIGKGSSAMPVSPMLNSNDFPSSAESCTSTSRRRFEGPHAQRQISTEEKNIRPLHMQPRNEFVSPARPVQSAAESNREDALSRERKLEVKWREERAARYAAEAAAASAARKVEELTRQLQAFETLLGNWTPPSFSLFSSVENTCTIGKGSRSNTVNFKSGTNRLFENFDQTMKQWTNICPHSNESDSTGTAASFIKEGGREEGSAISQETIVETVKGRPLCQTTNAVGETGFSKLGEYSCSAYRTDEPSPRSAVSDSKTGSNSGRKEGDFKSTFEAEMSVLMGDNGSHGTKKLSDVFPDSDEQNTFFDHEFETKEHHVGSGRGSVHRGTLYNDAAVHVCSSEAALNNWPTSTDDGVEAEETVTRTTANCLTSQHAYPPSCSLASPPADCRPWLPRATSSLRRRTGSSMEADTVGTFSETCLRVSPRHYKNSSDSIGRQNCSSVPTSPSCSSRTSLTVELNSSTAVREAGGCKDQLGGISELDCLPSNDRSIRTHGGASFMDNTSSSPCAHRVACQTGDNPSISFFSRDSMHSIDEKGRHSVSPGEIVDSSGSHGEAAVLGTLIYVRGCEPSCTGQELHPYSSFHGSICTDMEVNETRCCSSHVESLNTGTGEAYQFRSSLPTTGSLDQKFTFSELSEAKAKTGPKPIEHRSLHGCASVNGRGTTQLLSGQLSIDLSEASFLSSEVFEDSAYQKDERGRMGGEPMVQLPTKFSRKSVACLPSDLVQNLGFLSSELEVAMPQTSEGDNEKPLPLSVGQGMKRIEPPRIEPTDGLMDFLSLTLASKGLGKQSGLATAQNRLLVQSTAVAGCGLNDRERGSAA